ncbi:hypothetical protein HYY69_02840 [Candidatus Woesearchaeota archaeon]|nr:hypothetical protein [Candidatus Woesearchaeota archaeon]
MMLLKLGITASDSARYSHDLSGEEVVYRLLVRNKILDPYVTTQPDGTKQLFISDYVFLPKKPLNLISSQLKIAMPRLWQMLPRSGKILFVALNILALPLIPIPVPGLYPLSLFGIAVLTDRLYFKEQQTPTRVEKKTPSAQTAQQPSAVAETKPVNLDEQIKLLKALKNQLASDSDNNKLVALKDLNDFSNHFFFQTLDALPAEEYNAAVEPLISSLIDSFSADQNEEVKFAAIVSLGFLYTHQSYEQKNFKQMDGRRAIKNIIALLSSSSSSRIKINALSTLSLLISTEYDDELRLAAPRVIGLLSDTDPEVRKSAITILRSLTNKKIILVKDTIAALEPLVSDSDGSVRSSAHLLMSELLSREDYAQQDELIGTELEIESERERIIGDAVTTSPTGTSMHFSNEQVAQLGLSETPLVKVEETIEGKISISTILNKIDDVYTDKTDPESLKQKHELKNKIIVEILPLVHEPANQYQQLSDNKQEEITDLFISLNQLLESLPVKKGRFILGYADLNKVGFFKKFIARYKYNKIMKRLKQLAEEINDPTFTQGITFLGELSQDNNNIEAVNTILFDFFKANGLYFKIGVKSRKNDRVIEIGKLLASEDQGSLNLFLADIMEKGYTTQTYKGVTYGIYLVHDPHAKWGGYSEATKLRSSDLIVDGRNVVVYVKDPTTINEEWILSVLVHEIKHKEDSIDRILQDHEHDLEARAMMSEIMFGPYVKPNLEYFIQNYGETKVDHEPHQYGYNYVVNSLLRANEQHPIVSTVLAQEGVSSVNEFLQKASLEEIKQTAQTLAAALTPVEISDAIKRAYDADYTQADDLIGARGLALEETLKETKAKDIGSGKKSATYREIDAAKNHDSANFKVRNERLFIFVDNAIEDEIPIAEIETSSGIGYTSRQQILEDIKPFTDYLKQQQIAWAMSGSGSIADELALIGESTGDADVLIPRTQWRTLDQLLQEKAEQGILEELGIKSYTPMRYNPYDPETGIGYDSDAVGAIILNNGQKIDLISGFGYKVIDQAAIQQGSLEISPGIVLPVEVIPDRKTSRVVVFDIDQDGKPNVDSFFTTTEDGEMYMTPQALRVKYTFEQREDRLKMLDKIEALDQGEDTTKEDAYAEVISFKTQPVSRLRQAIGIAAVVLFSLFLPSEALGAESFESTIDQSTLESLKTALLVILGITLGFFSLLWDGLIHRTSYFLVGRLSKLSPEEIADRIINNMNELELFYENGEYAYDQQRRMIVERLTLTRVITISAGELREYAKHGSEIPHQNIAEQRQALAEKWLREGKLGKDEIARKIYNAISYPELESSSCKLGSLSCSLNIQGWKDASPIRKKSARTSVVKTIEEVKKGDSGLIPTEAQSIDRGTTIVDAGIAVDIIDIQFQKNTAADVVLDRVTNVLAEDNLEVIIKEQTKLFIKDKQSGSVKFVDDNYILGKEVGSSIYSKSAEEVLTDLEEILDSEELKPLLQEELKKAGYFEAAYLQRDIATSLEQGSIAEVADKFLKTLDPEYKPFTPTKNLYLIPKKIPDKDKVTLRNIYDTREVLPLLEKNIDGFKVIPPIGNHDVTVEYNGVRFIVFAGSNKPYEVPRVGIVRALNRIAREDARNNDITEDEIRQRIEVLKEQVFIE